jgi:hypothetical protein
MEDASDFSFNLAINTRQCLLFLGGVRVAGECLAINSEDGLGYCIDFQRATQVLSCLQTHGQRTSYS